MSDNDENQKKVIRKEVEISSIPNFVYEKPLVSIDENGEPQTTYRANGNKTPIKKLNSVTEPTVNKIKLYS